MELLRLQIEKIPRPTDTRIFHFDPPLSGFGLTCIGLAGGSSLARWRLEALDAQGNILATTGEMEFSKDPLPRTYRLRAEGIAAVRLFCDNRRGDSVWATYTSLPLVDIFLERPE